MVIFMRDKFYIYFLIFNLLLVTIFLVIFSYNYKICYYQNINMIYISNNRYDLLVDSNDFKLIRNNKSIYIDDKRYDYKINNYNKNIIKRNNKNYHNIEITINKKNKYKKNDLIEGSIISKKIRLIEIFKSIIS